MNRYFGVLALLDKKKKFTLKDLDSFGQAKQACKEARSSGRYLAGSAMSNKGDSWGFGKFGEIPNSVITEEVNPVQDEQENEELPFDQPKNDGIEGDESLDESDFIDELGE